jgi:hypothetical protein
VTEVETLFAHVSIYDDEGDERCSSVCANVSRFQTFDGIPRLGVLSDNYVTGVQEDPTFTSLDVDMYVRVYIRMYV